MSDVDAISLDRYWLSKALNLSMLSPDPATKVGAVIVRCGEVVSSGWNDLPKCIEPTPELLNDRERKLEVIVHAELNAICSAARLGRATAGAILYLAATDDTGLTWGGPPCLACSKHVIQAGIRRIVSLPQKTISKWKADLDKARGWLTEASVELTEVPYE